MKLTMYKCDRCGNIVEEGKQYVLLHPATESWDLCEKCVGEILSTVKVNAVLEVVHEPKQKRERKKKVDYGKIKALADAGWKVADIALDVRCSEQTVRNVLKGDQDDN